MEDHCLTRQLKRAEPTEASTQTISKRPKPDVLEESPFLLPSSDLSKKIDVPSASRANSDPSASSTSVIGNNYYVFLSFRGPDTRNGFVDHLYHRLKDVGMPFHPNFVFRDDKDLPFGEKIGENLISAIKHSKVSIPVISENYAASEWCLHELIEIMECKKTSGQIVLPVFYNVKPYEVRELQGAFGEAFKFGVHRFKEENVKKKGLVALRELVDSRVFESDKTTNGREGELVNELVEIIMRKQQQDFQPHLPVNLVAIEDRVAEVMELVDLACPDTRIIGIWGMGGIGKTTLATIIYKKLFDNFQYRSSLKDIRETTKSKGMEHVQSLLISDITKDPKMIVHDPEMGINIIRLSCEKKKVLIFLDDVDRRDHLDNLIGGSNFESGSRIIITCRDMALLDFEYKQYELKEMDYKDSMLLFSRYAFESGEPPIELEDLSRDIVNTTGGLPLALTVIGSLLKRRDNSIWKETLEKLRKMPHKDVQEKLKLSYDALEYNEKQMFLDIACFFIGTTKRIATYPWEDLQLYPNSGLTRMIELSLIKIDDKNQLRMHDQLRDLGRAIARPVDKKPWDCSRLWDEEAMKVLGRKEENENIEALCLDEGGSKEFMKRESFKKLPNLKFLYVKDVDFDRDFEGSFAELRWLKWERCRDSFEATNFHLEKLVVLDLSGDHSHGSGISENWRGWISIKMERLKVLNLSRCFNLRSTPNLSAFKILEMLILKHCYYLEEIDPSIGDIKRLVSLNLYNCRSLKKLPKQLGELENLEELVIGYTLIKEIPPCIGSLKKLKRLSVLHESLEQIPSSIGKLQELEELDLSHTKIKELPESIGELNKLKILRIYGGLIERLPSSIGKLQSLQEFDASECSKLGGQILVNEGGLSSLKILCLGWSNISGLPENLDQLHSLEHLDLRFCRELESLPKPPCNLLSLWLTCRSNELPSLSHLKYLQVLTLDQCGSLQSIPSLSHLKHLKDLSLSDCDSLQSIPELPSCIRTLDVWGCSKLERLANLSDLELLSELRLRFCNQLKQLDGLEALKSLTMLDLSRDPLLFGMEDEDFDEEPDYLHAIRGLEKLGSLEWLDITKRKHIQVLDLSKSEHLKRLITLDCKSLVEICCPSKFLELFDRRGCESLKKFPDFLPHDGLWSDLSEDEEGFWGWESW